ncbi:MAG: agmatinase [Candidatus Syntropharchaeia archaeon]
MKFSGSISDPEKAKYEIVGIPFDENASFRKGSKWAPDMIRRASSELETFLWERKVEVSEMEYYDRGNIEFESYEDLFELNFDGKKKIFLGGDHSITFPMVKSVGARSVISIDAHTDFRKIYMGNSHSNACVMRRIGENIGFDSIIEIGIRSSSQEEYEDLQRIKIYDLYSLRENGIEWVIDEISTINTKRTYLSIDIDVLDPGIAFGVGNPEPDGLNTSELIQLVRGIIEKKEVIACDIVEVNPEYDDVTAFIAARLVMEIIASWDLR